MKRNRRRNVLSTVAGTIAGLGLAMSAAGTPATANAQETFHWQVQSWTWPALEQHQYILDFADRIEVLTDGRLTIEVFDREAIVPGWEAVEAAGDGIIDGTFEWPGNHAGTDVGFNIFGPPPMALDEGWQLEYWMHEMGALELMREAYLEQFNVYIPGFTYWQAESLHSTVAIRSIEDLEGLSVRTPRGVTAEFFEALGATPVVLPPPEVYGALDRGVVDAGEFLTPSAHIALGYHEVTDYVIWPSVHQMLATVFFSVNRESWEELPSDIQEIVKTAMHEFSRRHSDNPYVNDFRSLPDYLEAGNEHIMWGDEEWEEARLVGMELWRSYVDQSELAANAVESLEEAMAIFGILPEE